MSKRARTGQGKRPGKKPKNQNRTYLPFPEEDLDDYEGVEWICSHLAPDKILWSSDTSKLKPNIDISQFDHSGANNVVNTWFVQSPQASSNAQENSSKWGAELHRAAELLKNANAILIVAGAGIGVDSGLPDYRGPSGLWKAYPALKDKGLSLEKMSHPDWFETDPSAAWGFYAHRARLYHSAMPHKGFSILRKIAEMKGGNYFVFTSNIDSQFQVAGFETSKIFEAHGSLAYLQCTDENCDEIWLAGPSEIPEVDENLKPIGELPQCPHCGALARPNVSMFGDTNYTWNSSRASAQKRVLMKWLKKSCPSFNSSASDDITSNRNSKQLVVIEIGCGVSLHSLRMEVELLMNSNDDRIHCIRINPHDHLVPDQKHVGLGLGSMESLIEIGKRLGLVEPVASSEESETQT